MGIMGFAGSGKTYTAAHTAIGLVEYMQSVGVSYADKPVFFLDTETGSDWVKPQFEAAGIPLFTAKTRAFQDLLASVKEAEKESSLLLVDSISHFWKEICDSYMKVKKRNRLQFEDWAFLKGEWGKFTDQLSTRASTSSSVAAPATNTTISRTTPARSNWKRPASR
jgi:KaiC/GvpD/RAD55 family RecA-like ATPase